MSSHYQTSLVELKKQPRRWCVTGAAGFIGSHLLQTLLENGQYVVGIDNFSTGRPANIEDVRRSVGDKAKNLNFIEADICDAKSLYEAFRGCWAVLHQAALGSVPRSIEDPATSTRANVEGFVSSINVAKECGVKRFVYASSSSVYGDDQTLPKVENKLGMVLSPYALTKYCDELYADLFARAFNFHSIGLRYFNVFGPRQDPNGAYAAVIPRWIGELLAGKHCTIFGDGETSRDFCYIENVVQANILAALSEDRSAWDRCYNIALETKTSLKDLYTLIRDQLKFLLKREFPEKPVFAEFRKGDVSHSLANVALARNHLRYEPQVGVEQGIKHTVSWFIENNNTQ